MSQTKKQSMIESGTNSLIAFLLALAVAKFILPLFFDSVSTGQAFGVVIVFTCVSIVRNYVMRRIFNRFQKPEPGHYTYHYTKEEMAKQTGYFTPIDPSVHIPKFKDTAK